jgi:hypothetical protein
VTLYCPTASFRTLGTAAIGANWKDFRGEISTDKLAVPHLASDDEKRSFPLAVSTFPFLLFAEIRVIHALSAVVARPLDWAPSHAGFVALRLRPSLLEGTTHLTEETVIRSTVARRVEIWLTSPE